MLEAVHEKFNWNRVVPIISARVSCEDFGDRVFRVGPAY